jgi:hypothetical protein
MCIDSKVAPEEHAECVIGLNPWWSEAEPWVLNVDSAEKPWIVHQILEERCQQHPSAGGDARALEFGHL